MKLAHRRNAALYCVSLHSLSEPVRVALAKAWHAPLTAKFQVGTKGVNTPDIRILSGDGQAAVYFAYPREKYLKGATDPGIVLATFVVDDDDLDDARDDATNLSAQRGHPIHVQTRSELVSQLAAAAPNSDLLALLRQAFAAEEPAEAEDDADLPTAYMLNAELGRKLLLTPIDRLAPDELQAHESPALVFVLFVELARHFAKSTGVRAEPRIYPHTHKTLDTYEERFGVMIPWPGDGLLESVGLFYWPMFWAATASTCKLPTGMAIEANLRFESASAAVNTQERLAAHFDVAVQVEQNGKVVTVYLRLGDAADFLRCHGNHEAATALCAVTTKDQLVNAVAAAINAFAAIVTNAV